MIKLCKYNNMLGKPNEGFHSTRILGYALWDIVGTILIAFLIAKYKKYNFLETLLGLFIVTQILHVLFCVNTAFVNNIMGIHFPQN